MDTQMCGPINSGLVRWRLTVYMDAVTVNGSSPVTENHIQSG